jgi:CHAT domain-containing protein
MFSASCSAGLVALSGPTSEINRDGTGEDILALQRGWLYSGAKSVLMRLWNTDDGLSSALMTAFYDRCDGSGATTKARALRLAMRDIRAAYANPYHWAPFILSGQP